ncbi:carboxypeptidase-like regulatory domain-containing protein [Chryseobacterium schmidteae]|uniref:carboxypeptidase-like regulatory domain-containing protein n=1 Tax=Chryseobacterium schmidteae TaxID=2730404 RepID=UPI00158BD22E|nr:carboxypeptidase-like regulatory domain-containing protein [Chryseobacterium schmidteae]
MTKIYSLFLILALLISCKSDSFIELDNPENPAIDFNFGNNAQRNFHGLVLSTDGSPVSGATITIGSATAQTNSKGIFVIKNASVKENFAYVKATKAGFVNGSRTMIPTNGSNRINIMMIPVTNTSTISSGTTSTVSLPNGTKVKFDGSFKDVNGNAYTGNVNVAMFHLKPSDQYLNELMPGSFLANSTNGNSRIMETYGMLHVQLTGASGQNLQIANGHTAEMTVAIDATQMSTSSATIPLWSFNEATGIWQEEGSATKVGNTYVGNVSHFSWWNYDVQFPVCTLKTTVKNQNGQPLSNIKIGLKRSSQVYETYGVTDANGTVSGLIPANETLVLKVYSECGTVLHTANVGPFTAGNIHTLPDIIIQPNTAISFTINGTLKNCAGGNVTDGLAVLQFGLASTNYFQGGTAIVTNGTFSISTLSCNANQQFSFEGFDITNMQTSGGINFTGVSPVTNLGNITVCTSVTEFVNYQIDTQPIVNCVLGFSAMLEAGNLNITHTQSPAGASPHFRLYAPGIGSVGTYTSGFTVYNGPNTPIPAAGNNLTLQISQLGTVNNYIDFTVNGTYSENVNGVPVTRTLSVTGHVKRDF